MEHLQFLQDEPESPLNDGSCHGREFLNSFFIDDTSLRFY